MFCGDNAVYTHVLAVKKRTREMRWQGGGGVKVVRRTKEEGMGKGVAREMTSIEHGIWTMKLLNLNRVAPRYSRLAETRPPSTLDFLMR